MTVASVEDRKQVRSEVLVRVYKSRADGQWRWQIKNRGNHEIEGAACEGYVDRRYCEENLMRITGFTPDVIIDEDG